MSRASHPDRPAPARPPVGVLWVVGTAVPAIAAGFHFYRGAPIDGAVFTVVALVCLLGWRTDSSAGRSGAVGARGATRPPVRVPGSWTVAAVLVVGAVLAVARRYSPVDALLFVALAAPALGLAATRGGPPPAPDADGPAPRHAASVEAPLRRAMACWAVVVLAISAVELVTYFLSTAGPAAEQAHPPLSDVVTGAFDSDYWRLVLALAWLWLGVGLFESLGILRVVRTRHPAPDSTPPHHPAPGRAPGRAAPGGTGGTLRPGRAHRPTDADAWEGRG